MIAFRRHFGIEIDLFASAFVRVGITVQLTSRIGFDSTKQVHLLFILT